MDVGNALLGVWGAVSVVALVSSIVSLWLHYRTGSVRQLTSEVRQTSLDVHELFDTVEKWTRRDRVRRLREGRVETEPAVPLTPADRKAQLRAQFAAQRGQV